MVGGVPATTGTDGYSVQVGEVFFLSQLISVGGEVKGDQRPLTEKYNQVDNVEQSRLPASAHSNFS